MTISTEPLHPPYRLEVGIISEKGPLHDTNEDSYRLDAEIGLFLLADGMGGYQAGEVASRLAIDVLYRALAGASTQDIRQTLGNALLSAHRTIQETAGKQDAYRGMGTTALIAWIRIPELLLWTAHVGNSRAYLWRDGTLQQLTEDHTMLNELRKANRLPSRRSEWPSPAVLSQALGSRQHFLAPGFGEWLLQIGDRILLCSDGLSDLLTAEEINRVVSGSGTPQQICEHLAQAVHQKGLRDDCTAILVEIGSR